MLGSKILKRCKARLSLVRQLRQRHSLTHNNKTTAHSGSSGPSLMQFDGAGDLDIEPINLDSDDNNEITTPTGSLETSPLQADGPGNSDVDPFNLDGGNNNENTTPSGSLGASLLQANAPGNLDVDPFNLDGGNNNENTTPPESSELFLMQADGPGDLEVNSFNPNGSDEDFDNFINESPGTAVSDNDVLNATGESASEREIDELFDSFYDEAGPNGDELHTSSVNATEHTGSGTNSAESVRTAQPVQPDEPVPNHWGSSTRIIDITDVSDAEEWPAEMIPTNPSVELGTQSSSEPVHPNSNYTLQQVVASGSSHNVEGDYGQPGHQDPGSVLYGNSDMFGVQGTSAFAGGSNAEHLPFGTWNSVASNPFMAEANPASAGQIPPLAPAQTFGRAPANAILRQAIENSRKRNYEALNAVVQSSNNVASGSGIAADGSSSLADRHADLARPTKRAKLNKKEIDAMRAKRDREKKKGKSTRRGQGGRGGRGGKRNGKQEAELKEESSPEPESVPEPSPEPVRFKVKDKKFWNSLDPNSRGVRPGNFPDIDKLLNPTNDVAQATIYDSASEARADHVADRDIEVDDTIPKTHAAKKAIVVALTDLMMDNSWAQDGTRALKSWIRVEHPRHVFEKAAWELLEALIRRNTNGPELLYYDYLKFPTPPKWMSFRDRLSKIMEALVYHKAVLKHILDPEYMNLLVEDPVGSLYRVRENKHVNRKKAQLIRAAQEALKKEQEEALRAQSLGQAPVEEGLVEEGLVPDNDEYSADDEESADESIDLESPPTSPPLATAGPSSEKGNGATNANGSTPQVPVANSAVVQNGIAGAFVPAGMGLDDLENLMGEPSFTAGGNAAADSLFPIADPHPPFMATAPAAHNAMPGSLQDLMDPWMGNLPLVPFGAQPIDPAYVDPGTMAQGNNFQPNIRSLNGINQGNMAAPPQNNIETVDPRMIMAQNSLVPAGRTIQRPQHGQMQKAMGRDAADPNMFNSHNSTNALVPLPDYIVPMPLIDMNRRHAGPTISPCQEGVTDYLQGVDPAVCAWVESPAPRRAAPQNNAAAPPPRAALPQTERAMVEGVFLDIKKRKQAEAGIQDDSPRRKRKQ